MNEIQNNSSKNGKGIDFVLKSDQNSTMTLSNEIGNINYNFRSNPFKKTQLSDENIVYLPFKKKRRISSQFLIVSILLIILCMNFFNDDKKNYQNHSAAPLQASVIPTNQSNSDYPVTITEKNNVKQKIRKNSVKEEKPKVVNAADFQKSEKFVIPEFPVIKSKNKNQLKEYGQMAEKIRTEYVNRFKKIAMEEQKKFGIPSGLTLALAILNSEFGNSEQAKEGNNHFSIKCSDNSIPIGKGMKGQIVTDGVCFTSYTNPWNSFRANSQFLKQKYSAAFESKSTDKIISKLEIAGFFENKNFSSATLRSVITMYHLD